MTSAVARFLAPVSPLPGVTPAQWHHYRSALMVQATDAVSESGGLGCYDMRPRRLVELGLATNLRQVRGPSGRAASACDLTAPLTADGFLADQFLQHLVLVRSTRLYHKALLDEEIPRPRGVSVAGALAVLHLGGTKALAGWPELFPNTRSLYERAREAF